MTNVRLYMDFGALAPYNSAKGGENMTKTNEQGKPGQRELTDQEKQALLEQVDDQALHEQSDVHTAAIRLGGDHHKAHVERVRQQTTGS